MNAVFKELNQGEAITAGLRKVTDDMKAKNRADRSGFVSDGGVPSDKARESAGSGAAAGAAAAKAAKPAKLALEGKRWSIEHQRSARALSVEGVTMKQTVYAYDCVDCVITIKGKANCVTLDGCVRTAVVFDSALATCEVVNCSSVEVQCLVRVPTVSVDKVDGCQIYLGADALGAEILTAKSSEVNVVEVPAEAEEAGEPSEHPVPEQFVTKRGADGRWVTVPVDHF